MQRYDVGRRRIDNALDLRRQRLVGAQLLGVKFVPVIDATNAADDVAEATLGMIGIDAGAAHE